MKFAARLKRLWRSLWGAATAPRRCDLEILVEDSQGDTYTVLLPNVSEYDVVLTSPGVAHLTMRDVDGRTYLYRMDTVVRFGPCDLSNLDADPEADVRVSTDFDL